MKNKHKNYIFIFIYNRENLGREDFKIYQKYSGYI